MDNKLTRIFSCIFSMHVLLFFTEKMKIILENQRNHVNVNFFKFVNLKNLLK